MLILPQQNWFDSLPADIISQKEWGINPNHISTIKNGETKNIKDIAKHLINSIARYEFMAFDNSSNQISSIKFKDKDREGNITFEAIIPLPNLRQFTNKLTDTFKIEMNKQRLRMITTLRQTSMPAANTGFASGGVMCKLGALCFISASSMQRYSSSVQVDCFVLRNPTLTPTPKM